MEQLEAALLTGIQKSDHLDIHQGTPSRSNAIRD
jgi:hypothetical protein